MDDLTLTEVLDLYVKRRTAKMDSLLWSLLFVGDIVSAPRHTMGIKDYWDYDRAVPEALVRAQVGSDELTAFKTSLGIHMDELAVRGSWYEKLALAAGIIVSLVLVAMGEWPMAVRLVCFAAVLGATTFYIHAALSLNHRVLIYQRFAELIDEALRLREGQPPAAVDDSGAT